MLLKNRHSGANNGDIPLGTRPDRQAKCMDLRGYLNCDHIFATIALHSLYHDGRNSLISLAISAIFGNIELLRAILAEIGTAVVVNLDD